MTDVLWEDTGELEDIPEGEDDLRYLVYQAYDAGVQKKAWGAREGMLKAMVLDKQDGKREVYDDLVASVRSPVREKYDADGFRERIKGIIVSLAVEAPTKEVAMRIGYLGELICAAKAFDKKSPHLSEKMQALISEFLYDEPGNSFVIIEPVRKRAPGS